MLLSSKRKGAAFGLPRPDSLQEGSFVTLRINLKDGERVIVNGAVMRAHGRLSLDVESDASILRGRDVMVPEEATTPARRLYFAVMLAYVAVEERDANQTRAVDFVGDLVAALSNPTAISKAISVAQKIAAGQYYKALGDCRWLIAYEEEQLGALAGQAPIVAPGLHVDVKASAASTS